MIKVYQFILTDEEMTAINTGGQYTPRIKAYFERSFDASFKAENFQYYTHVANVDVNDMDAAFEAMNLWEESIYFEDVFKLGRCSSMSVGDILEMEDGSKHRVASFGFTRLENYQRD